MEFSQLIDIAVLCQEYSTIDVSCENSHITILDVINITKQDFLSLFYPHKENFGINKNVIDNKKFRPFLSFESEYRTVKGKKFFLLEQILQNLESDLNLSRNCFTTNSKIELANEFSNIKTLCDMNCCSVTASLPWSNIETILNNYITNGDKNIEPIFVISVCFKTPTPTVKDTIIKFHYKFSI